MRKRDIKDLYTLEYEEGPNGRLIEKPVYIGENISFASPKYTKRKVTLRLLVAAILLLGLMITAGLLDTESSRFILIGVPFVFVFLPVIYLFRGVFALMERSEPITMVTYNHSIQRSLRSYKGLFVISAYIVLVSFLHLLVTFHQLNWKLELFFVILNISTLLFSHFQIQYISRVQETIVFQKQTVDLDNEPEKLA